jgi:uncharacterized membrane protein
LYFTNSVPNPVPTKIHPNQKPQRTKKASPLDEALLVVPLGGLLRLHSVSLSINILAQVALNKKSPAFAEDFLLCMEVCIKLSKFIGMISNLSNQTLNLQELLLENWKNSLSLDWSVIREDLDGRISS